MFEKITETLGIDTPELFNTGMVVFIPMHAMIAWNSSKSRSSFPLLFCQCSILREMDHSKTPCGSRAL